MDNEPWKKKIIDMQWQIIVKESLMNHDSVSQETHHHTSSSITNWMADSIDQLRIEFNQLCNHERPQRMPKKNLYGSCGDIGIHQWLSIGKWIRSSINWFSGKCNPSNWKNRRISKRIPENSAVTLWYIKHEYNRVKIVLRHIAPKFQKYPESISKGSQKNQIR